MQIIIATANLKLSASVEKTIIRSLSADIHIVKSSSELNSYYCNEEKTIVILGPLKDKPAIYVARTVPDTWEVIILLSSNSPLPYYVSNVVPVNLPIDKREFIELIQNLGDTDSQTFGSKTTAKKERSEEDKFIIEQAKKKIMAERGITESDAHKLLQRYSMNLGITLIQSANRFLG